MGLLGLLESFGTFLRRLKACMARLTPSDAVFRACLGRLGAVWSASEPSWKCLEPYWGMGPSWEPLGPPWWYLGPSWSHLGSLWAILQRCCGYLWICWAILGHIGLAGAEKKQMQQSFKHFAQLNDVGSFGPFWRTYWKPLGLYRRLLGSPLGSLGPS